MIYCQIVTCYYIPSLTCYVLPPLFRSKTATAHKLLLQPNFSAHIQPLQDKRKPFHTNLSANVIITRYITAVQTHATLKVLSSMHNMCHKVLSWFLLNTVRKPLIKCKALSPQISCATNRATSTIHPSKSLYTSSLTLLSSSHLLLEKKNAEQNKN